MRCVCVSVTVHLPSSLHPPDGEGIGQPLVGHVGAAAGKLHVEVVRAEHLVEKVYVATGQLQRLDLAELVGGQCGDDLPQLGEGVIERLRPLALPHVGQHALGLQVLQALRLPPGFLSATSASVF